MMTNFLEFMGELSAVQEKLSDVEYKTIADSAQKLYDSAVEYRNKKAMESQRDMERLGAIAGKAIDALVCKVVRDVPWDELTPNKMVDRLTAETNGAIPRAAMNKTTIKAIMDRETALLHREDRTDPMGKLRGLRVMRAREERKAAGRPY